MCVEQIYLSVSSYTNIFHRMNQIATFNTWKQRPIFKKIKRKKNNVRGTMIGDEGH